MNEMNKGKGIPKDFVLLLRTKANIKRRDWGGDRYMHGDKEIDSSYKINQLSQEQAETICDILKIPLTEDAASQIPKGDLCPCGCGEVLKKGTKFRQGHDTRLRWRLVKEYKRTKSKATLKELRKWDWEKYLG